MSNFQPGDETFDDVTGHKMFNRGALPDNDEVEGHRITGRALPSGDDEVEGHRLER